MGFCCLNRVSLPMLVLSIACYNINALLGLVKPILILIFSLFGLIRHHDDQNQQQGQGADENHHPSPAAAACLVPPPVFSMVQSVKNQLPVMPYSSTSSCLVNRRIRIRSNSSAAANCNIGDADADDHPTCIVCMDCVEGSHEVRELSNCNHVFHRGCLDAWIDHGNLTCPLCKANLLMSAQGNQDDDSSHSDSWRRARMMYLFGQDDNYDMILQHTAY